ncbi:hypothetical protein CC2G_006144 [Coprinopsis cinerea AmutBmut pab1-1]|nr:hypothetical protein CC2G_006144 [Coprinopsis cinerea AmutBmut pab1-1]
MATERLSIHPFEMVNKDEFGQEGKTFQALQASMAEACLSWSKGGSVVCPHSRHWQGLISENSQDFSTIFATTSETEPWFELKHYSKGLDFKFTSSAQGRRLGTAASAKAVIGDMFISATCDA